MFRLQRTLRPVQSVLKATQQKRFLSIHEYRGAELLKMVMLTEAMESHVLCSMALVCQRGTLRLRQKRPRRLPRSWVCELGLDAMN
jgi:hypothetical protein